MLVQKSFPEIFVDRCPPSIACYCEAVQLDKIDGNEELTSFEVDDHAAVRDEIPVAQMAFDVRFSIYELVL